MLHVATRLLVDARHRVGVLRVSLLARVEAFIALEGDSSRNLWTFIKRRLQDLDLLEVL